jgi:Raf kinase inhibitor-like YbhB/YbcL family protein
MKKTVLLFVLILILTACSPSLPEPTGPFTLSSLAFTHEGTIPADYSCDGAGTSPALAWTNAPADTKSFALIMDDQDAMDFVHWVIFNIPASATGLNAGLSLDAELEDGSLQGRNSTYVWGYLGPCPPMFGGAHRYLFTLYALDSMLELDKSAIKKDLLAAMEGHILAETELIGSFEH